MESLSALSFFQCRYFPLKCILPHFSTLSSSSPNTQKCLQGDQDPRSLNTLMEKLPKFPMTLSYLFIYLNEYSPEKLWDLISTHMLETLGPSLLGQLVKTLLIYWEKGLRAASLAAVSLCKFCLFTRFDTAKADSYTPPHPYPAPPLTLFHLLVQNISN